MNESPLLKIEDLTFSFRTYGGVVKAVRGVPRLDLSRDVKLVPIQGTPPDLFSPPVGCPFAARCEYAMKVCREEMPPEFELSEGHYCACWLRHPNAPEIQLTRF